MRLEVILDINDTYIIPDRKYTYILFFGSAHGRLNGNVFLINAHGVLRRVGAVTEIPGTL